MKLLLVSGQLFLRKVSMNAVSQEAGVGCWGRAVFVAASSDYGSGFRSTGRLLPSDLSLAGASEKLRVREITVDTSGGYQQKSLFAKPGGGRSQYAAGTTVPRDRSSQQHTAARDFKSTQVLQINHILSQSGIETDSCVQPLI